MSIPTIVKQHSEDAATKWWKRGKHLNNPRCRFEELVELDQSIDVHLDGLREAGAKGVERAYTAYATSIDRRAEDVAADGFVVLALAFLSNDMQTIREVTAQVTGKPGFAEALNGVFAWLTSPTIAGIVEAQFANQEPTYRHPALMHGHAHVFNDSFALKNALQDSPPESLAIAIDAVANCGRTDLLAPILDVLNNFLSNLRSSVCFSAAQGALLLGDRQHAIPALQAVSLGDTPHSIDAVKLLSLVLPFGDLQEHLRQLEQKISNPTILIEIAGWSGNPTYVPWLIAQMSDEANGRYAGEAFRLITGFDIEANDAIPDMANARGSKKQPYPMPDAAKLSTWWEQNHLDFSMNTKFFLGRPLSIEWLNHLLGLAEQSHRELAALHRMLIQPGTSRFPTRASSSIQLLHLQKL